MRGRVRLLALAALCLCAYLTEGRVPRAQANPPRETVEAIATASGSGLRKPAMSLG